MGVLYQGSPKTSLNANCGSGLSNAECILLKTSIIEEEKALNDEVGSYEWYPVLSVGIVYKF